MKPAKIVKLSPTTELTIFHSEFENNVWDGRKLGADIKPSDNYTINFKSIAILWLRQAAKQFIRYTFATQTWSTCQDRVSAVKRFSRFLEKRYPQCQPKDINRKLVVEFLSYLVSKKYADNTRITTIAYLQNFFYLSAQHQWAEITGEILFFKGDAPKLKKPAPRYIPEEVLEQLNNHLNFLPEPLMRMVLIMQECGMRISELCRLKFDCLRQDSSGTWWLTYYQFKMKKDHSICVSNEVVAVVLEQQEYIKNHLGLKFEYLFCANKSGSPYKHRNNKSNIPKFNPVPRAVRPATFSLYLNELAQDKNICSSSGKLWHFQSHQFRHTIATRMINSDVPIHIVKRYLGHESFEMTMRYAHIHDKTLRSEFAKLHGKVVNVAGQIVASSNPDLDAADLQWFKKNIQAQALPNGSCALPTIMHECPHANACLTCTHFRTTVEFLDQHKEQLQQTEKLIEKAKTNGWKRQVEMNERVAVNLRNIISTLEIENVN